MNEKHDRVCVALDSILKGRFTDISYSELYGTSQELVMYNCGSRLYDSTVNAIHDQCRETNTTLMGHMVPDTILEVVVDAWLNFKRRFLMIRDALKYVETVHVRRCNVMGIREVGYRSFFNSTPIILQKVVDSALERITRFRNGELVDLSTVRACFVMCKDLDSVTKGNLFNEAFLSATVMYYARTSMRHLTVPDYLKWVTDRLRLEGVLAKTIMVVMADLFKKLESSILQELIEKHAPSLIDDETSGVIVMLTEKRFDSLRTLHELLTDSESMKRYVELFGKYIISVGSEIVEGRCNVIPQLIQLKDAMNEVCVLVKDASFFETMKTSFKNVLNVDCQCAQHLAIFFDQCDQSDPSPTLIDTSMWLFRSIDDKDVFETCYREHLAKRLLNPRAKRFDGRLIQKFKIECGNQFTSKLECMCNDVAELSPNVSVLTSLHWPTMVCHPIRLPRELNDLKSTFENEYHLKHPRRILNWAYEQGFCVVKAFGWFNESYEFTTSIYQATVLSLFTDTRRKITFRELLDETNIPIKEMKRHLISLATSRYQILIKSGSKKIFNDDDEYVINDGYTSKLNKVNIPLVIMPDDPVVNAVLSENVEEMRRHGLEAVIVRIMKNRKALKESELFEQCIKHLSFKPSLKDFRGRMGSLIDREYVSREEDQMVVYMT